VFITVTVHIIIVFTKLDMGLPLRQSTADSLDGELQAASSIRRPGRCHQFSALQTPAGQSITRAHVRHRDVSTEIRGQPLRAPKASRDLP